MWTEVALSPDPNRISIPRGAAFDVALLVRDADGEPLDLTGHKLYFTVRHSEVEPVVVSKTTDDPLQVETADQETNPGEATIHVVSSDTSGLTPGSYLYDVWLELDAPGDDRRRVVATTVLVVESTVTTF